MSEKATLRRYLLDSNQPSNVSDLAADPPLVRDQAVLDEAASIFKAEGKLEEVGAVVAGVNPGEALEITFHQFDHGGFGKGATHRLTIQRLADTHVPESQIIDVGSNNEHYGDELVAILNSQIIWLEHDQVYAPNPLMSSYTFMQDGQEVVLPLFAILPPADIIRAKTNAVIVATRYPKAYLSVEKSNNLLFPKGEITPSDNDAI
jgi:hypothetical protein